VIKFKSPWQAIVWAMAYKYSGGTSPYCHSSTPTEAVVNASKRGNLDISLGEYASVVKRINMAVDMTLCKTVTRAFVTNVVMHHARQEVLSAMNKTALTHIQKTAINEIARKADSIFWEAFEEKELLT
jgi:hypothetical protein